MKVVPPVCPRNFDLTLRHRLVAIFGTALLSTSAVAAATDWTGAVNGNWDLVTANWTGGTGSLFTTGDPANFATASNPAINVTSPISALSMAINSSGFSFSGSPITLTGTTAGNLTVANGVTATISNVLNLPAAGGSISVGAGSVLNLNAIGSSVIRDFAGSGTTNILAGTYTSTNHADLNGNVVVSNTGTYSISGAGATIGVNAAGSLTVDSGGTVNAASGTGVGIALGFNVSGAGTMTLKNGGTVNMGTRTLVIGKDSLGAGGTALLDIQGGTLNSTEVIRFGETTLGVNGTRALNISGGTTTVKGLVFQSATGGNASHSVTMTGGSMYLGANGIQFAGGGTVAPNITLSGGTIGASTAWTGTLAMTLATVGGNITFKAADASNVAQNITLSGVLSGSGGLVKTGGGTLLLSGANTYTGDTTVQAGTLSITTGFLADNGDVYLTTGSVFDLNFTGSDTIRTLYIDGVAQAPGTYGGSGSGASNISSLFSSTGLGTLTVTSVPEPATWVLVGGGLAFVALRRRRKLV
jgi:autotransporter-associated beta strand protein